ncbi:Putative papain-like cysteine peptidase [Paenibacillus sp. 1_12]|uniref:DUF1796 family putative cysteine peptidase n=1 Tax=Paenibacillus sp. 1_12 TaxID=1566278 RepID=UPI0008F35EE9|nr:DUF1796 family putative cysteine peptidase [Paenibacillus sp. 1_12]SFK82434.1 Putative papain-like cysteine peptidase [Paenibacillus sp. 1_12]
MKWNECTGFYKAYLSLGSTCQTAYQLKRLGLRQFAGPLDWFISDSVPDLVQLIRKRFYGFMEFDHLQLIDRTYDHFVVRDSDYEVVSFHDFPRYLTIERVWDAYPPFKGKIDRRVQRFLKTARFSSPVLLVRTQTSRKEAIQLKAALNTMMYGKYRLLIVNNHSSGLNSVVHEDWGIDGVCSVNVPSGRDWRGSDQAWNTIMKGFMLSH